MKNELEWLRFFYANARHAMGPASDDIYSMIQQDYQDLGCVVPSNYKEEEEDYD